MVDAVVGAVIMVVAATSLLFAIEVAEKAFQDSGYYPITPEEEGILKRARPGENVKAFSRDNLEKF